MPIFHFLGLELGCVHLCLFPFSRFGIRLCSFVPTFRFLGLELGCVHLCLLFSRFGIRLFVCAYFPFSRFGIRLCSFVPIFHFLGLELGCVHLCLLSVFSVWN